MHSAPLRLLGVVLFASLLGTGCVQTSMLPAQQLDSGTTAVGASLDEPGFLYIPRANIQLTQGIGGGDVSVNLSGPPFGAGITGRAYLSDRVNADVQIQATKLNDGDEPATGLLLVGVQEVPTGDDLWYVGGQLGVIHGPGFVLTDAPQTHTLPTVGASIGLGPFDLGSDWQLQVELASNVPLGHLEDDDPPVPATRLSVGFFHLFH